MTNAIDDELLTAYLTGTLDDATRRKVQRAIDEDPVLARRAREQAGLLERLQAAYRPVLDEPVPARLLEAATRRGAAHASPSSPAAPVDLGAERERRQRRRLLDTGWARWGGIAAGVLVGLAIGRAVPVTQGAEPFALRAGHLVAQGSVADALSGRLAAAPPSEAGVALQLSFVDKSGDYCRTFSTADLAGLACRRQGDWSVEVVARTEAAAPGAMRQAATALPAAVLGAVERQIEGNVFDGPAEREALAKGWRR